MKIYILIYFLYNVLKIIKLKMIKL